MRRVLPQQVSMKQFGLSLPAQTQHGFFGAAFFLRKLWKKRARFRTVSGNVRGELKKNTMLLGLFVTLRSLSRDLKKAYQKAGVPATIEGNPPLWASGHGLQRICVKQKEGILFSMLRRILIARTDI